MASKNIKGITIKIGGETTELQKALKGVDQQVYTLNSDLKSLNQALKLDPKNTELLAQKQDVLARNIAATKDKLETLKEAQRQMGDYNKLTDEQKKSYNALSLEIAKSENALRGMEKELKATSTVDLSKLKEGLKKVGDVAVEVSKKLLQVSTAVAGALAGIVAAGVKSYADLEQNLGGVETLFKENADKVVENAKNAYKTAGVSANEYMAGVTSFSASLLQSLGGDTAKAADVADMAFRDMSDNANKFGTDMSSIQSAYQGFAKQNYTMLDNLKLGYGGTKTEMERLLKDAEKLSGQKYDIKNLNDVYEAIHVIQEDLGVTGTTAKEASETISGSANAMKAAFDNFLNGSGSPDALAESVNNMLLNIGRAVDKLAPSILQGISSLIQQIIPLLVDILSEQIPYLAETITNLINSLLDMVTKNTSQISQTVTDIINLIVEFLTTNIPTILKIGIELLLALAKGITDSIPELAKAIPEIIDTVVTILIENLPLILEAGITLLTALVEAIPVVVEALVDNLPKIIDIIITTLLNNLQLLIQASIKLLMALVTAIPTICLELIKAIPTIISSIVKSLWDNRGKILEAGKNLLLNLRDGIINNLQALVTKIKELPGKIKGWLEEGISKLSDVGGNFVKGIWEGISNGLSWIKSKLKGWVGSVVDFCKKLLGIKSPSKVMADQVGKYMAEGIGVGFDDEMQDVEKDMAKAMPIDTLVGEVNNAMRGLNYGIQNSINPQINPNISLDQNYNMMADAMKEALSTMEIELDDREVGKFVTKTITEEIYN